MTTRREPTYFTRTRDWDAVFTDSSRVRLEFIGVVVLVHGAAVAGHSGIRAAEFTGWDFREHPPGSGLYDFVDVKTLPNFSHFDRTP